MPYWKIFDLSPKNEPKVLFHGIQRSKVMPIGAPIKADKKWVTDGFPGTPYVSGFHVLPTRADAVEYLTRFKEPLKKVIVPVYVDSVSLRRKTHSRSPVFLSDWMMIRPEDWPLPLE